jgi:CRP/FNR family transcriptional regulator
LRAEEATVVPRDLLRERHADASLTDPLRSVLTKLSADRTPRTYRPGQIIFYQGEPCLGIYVIESGVVKLYRSMDSDREVLIRLLGPDDMLGYRAVLTDEPNPATAEAVERSQISVISKSRFLSTLAREPEVSRWLMRKLAIELRMSEDQIVIRTQEPVLQRTARLLLDLLDARGATEHAGLEITTPPRRTDIARMIGTTPETFSRTLRILSRRGILEIDRRRIRVKRLQALRELAG